MTKFEMNLRDLCKLIENDSNWHNYVEEKNVKFLKDYYNHRDLSRVLSENNISYGNFKAKVLASIDRIQNKNTNRIRNGKSEKAKKLLELLEQEDWKTVLTEREIKYATLFKMHKNFYSVGRLLDVNPSNVAGALYGTNQRKGVINKLEELKKETSM